ncbi:MAG: methyltransferase domain-containing protein [Ktedonobacteraceae bacterium]|nr:methyltransferase domain-containing protein [Chloroflexota bacterium]
MSTPVDQNAGEGIYFNDGENATEMARLMLQDRLVTMSMGGILPERTDALPRASRVLDLGCGPGGWVLDVAFAYPQSEVIGVDSSNTVIEYARAQAWTRGLHNASFQVKNILKPLDFPDASFDLVNARMIFSFVPAALWPALLAECKRLLRPGGTIRLTEGEMPISNSESLEKMSGLITQALKMVKQSFSPDGRHIGITPMLGRLLRDAGYTDIQKKAYAAESSAGTELREGFYQDVMAGYKLVQPVLVGLNLVSQEEVDDLYQRMLAEIMLDDFCEMMFLLTAWGRK